MHPRTPLEMTDDELQSAIAWAYSNRQRPDDAARLEQLYDERARRKPLVDQLTARSGQRYRSLRLSDYTVRLTSPTGQSGGWYIQPSGSSAHGAYTVNEREILNPDLYERVLT